MKSSALLALTVPIALVSFAAPAAAGGGEQVFTTTLSGDVEVPPGDPDGEGTAVVTLREGQLCFELRDVSGVAPITAGHIHRAPEGEAGPVVVPLFTDEQGLPTEEQFSVDQSCVDADAAVLSEIRENPSNFYINLHNAEYPGGAVRGQLGAGSLPVTGTDATELALFGAGLVAAGVALRAAGRRRYVGGHVRRG